MIGSAVGRHRRQVWWIHGDSGTLSGASKAGVDGLRAIPATGGEGRWITRYDTDDIARIAISPHRKAGTTVRGAFSPNLLLLQRPPERP